MDAVLNRQDRHGEWMVALERVRLAERACRLAEQRGEQRTDAMLAEREAAWDAERAAEAAYDRARFAASKV